jgi:NodT family efflux transporter outer membrane factor (OMF) lipoprotein
MMTARIWAATLMLAGCAVGPDFLSPAAPGGAGYSPNRLPGSTVSAAVGGGAAQSFIEGRDIPGEWWALFHSAELNQLIAQALRANPDLRAAAAALRAARENVRAQEGAFFPSISAAPQVERTRESAAQVGSAAPGSTLFTLVNTSISASYTLDVFGGVRREVEQLQAQADYERFLLEAAYLTLTANVVTTAVTEASLRGQIQATNDIIAAERTELELVNRQLTLGGVSRADVLQQQATLEATEATLPALSGQLAQARNQLAVYLGETPNLYTAAPFELSSLDLPEQLPVSLPSDLVNQRPDIQEYAALLHAASANVGIATANLLPQLSLTASVGSAALSAGKLFTPGTEIFTLAAALTQPIFEGGTLLARRRSAVAALEQALAQYESTVLSAFQTVGNALVALQTDAQTLRADLAASQTAADSLALVRRQLSEGGTTYLAVLAAEQTDQNARINLVRAQAARFTDTAALFQALGGGWWHRGDVDPKIAACCGVLP